MRCIAKEVDCVVTSEMVSCLVGKRPPVFLAHLFGLAPSDVKDVTGMSNSSNASITSQTNGKIISPINNNKKWRGRV